MQIELVETFLDICETRSFNRSAERLGVTQSTVSGRVRTLERTLGRPLFLRSRAGVGLTTAGMGFEPHARALRRSWAEALRATRDAGEAAVSLRVAMQHDLALSDIGAWIRAMRETLPQAAFYIETDYSAQMCSDLVAGALDIGLVFSPRPHPDLHIEALGEVRFSMVSTETDALAAVDPDTYLLANHSPAFARAHAARHPNLSRAAISSGQSATLAAMLADLGGAAYLLDATAAGLVAAGTCRFVEDAPSIAQTVHGCAHVRDRHRNLHRRLMAILRARIADIAAPERRRRLRRRHGAG